MPIYKSVNFNTWVKMSKIIESQTFIPPMNIHTVPAYKQSNLHHSYPIRSNYRTYPYKRTVKKFRSLQIIASILFVYFFIKAYVVDTHLNCDLSIQFKWVPTTYAFIKKIRKKKKKKSHNHQINPFLIFFIVYPW